MNTSIVLITFILANQISASNSTFVYLYEKFQVLKSKSSQMIINYINSFLSNNKTIQLHSNGDNISTTTITPTSTVTTILDLLNNAELTKEESIKKENSTIKPLDWTTLINSSATAFFPIPGLRIEEENGSYVFKSDEKFIPGILSRPFDLQNQHPKYIGPFLANSTGFIEFET